MSYWTITILPNTYKFNREYKYQFTTETGSEYLITLDDYSELLGIPDQASCKALFLSVVRKKRIKREKDVRIRDTIVSIILDYLRRNEDIIAYICSNDKGQSHVRRKLFLKWFNEFNPGYFRQVTRTFHHAENIFIINTRNKSAKRFLSWLDEQFSQ